MKYFTDDRKRVRKIDGIGGRPSSKSMSGENSHKEGEHDKFAERRLIDQNKLEDHIREEFINGKINKSEYGLTFEDIDKDSPKFMKLLAMLAKDRVWLKNYAKNRKEWQKAEEKRLKSLTAKEGDMIRVSKGQFGRVIGRKPANEFPKSDVDWLQVRLWKPIEMKGVIVQVPIDKAEVVTEHIDHSKEIPYHYK